METTEQSTQAVTPHEVAILNEARRILNVIADRARNGGDTTNRGIVYYAADRAESSVFQLLNVASSYGGAHLTAAQLHMDCRA